MPHDSDQSKEQHPYLSSSRANNIESWKNNVSKDRKARSPPRQPASSGQDPNVQAYVNLKKSMYGKSK